MVGVKLCALLRERLLQRRLRVDFGLLERQRVLPPCVRVPSFVHLAVLLERRVVQVALLGFLAATAPHFVFHLTTIGSYDAVDNVLSLGGFAAQVALAVWLLIQTRSDTRSPASWPASTPSRPRRAVH